LELIDIIHKTLPQIQCGRCETPGCYQYANDIAKGAPHDRCVPGGAETLDKLNNILDKQINNVDLKFGPSIQKQKVKIIEDDCIGCKKCIGACPVDAIVGATNLMHSVIDDICTGCELCIEPCPVDCIEIVESSSSEVKGPRDNSQYYFDLKESLNTNAKREKLVNKSPENLNISDEINIRIANRKVDKLAALNKMQSTIAKEDLIKLHEFNPEDASNFIEDKNDS
jgi:RnfABCDGE-type electron transport complex B subunit